MGGHRIYKIYKSRFSTET